MSLTVVEVLERSKQGRTEPYICRCDDGEVYFVKGQSATRPVLIPDSLLRVTGKPSFLIMYKYIHHGQNVNYAPHSDLSSG